jgi:toxin ParE1/3/4
VAGRSVRLRERAATDIERVTDYYVGEAGPAVALRFVDAVERALGQISRSPLSGSLRFSYELEIPDLRVRPVARFPYLVFYVVGDDIAEVWRILHTRRDIPSVIADDIET